jgi:hypothetical protein
MKTFRIFQIFDLLVQSTILVTITFSVALAAALEPGFLIWSLLFLFPLGVWQLFSALILGIGLKDYYRRTYLITAITFSSLFFSVGTLIGQLELNLNFDLGVSAFIVAIFISFVAAIVYFIYSYRFYFFGSKQETHDIA